MKFKKILISLMISIIVLVNSGSIFAIEQNSGTTDREEIARIYNSDPELREEVRLEDIISINSTIKTFPNHQNEDQTPGVFRPMGLISKSKMRLTITTARVPGSTRYFKAIATATWLTQPAMHFNDIIAMSWGNGYTSSNDTLQLTYESGTNRYRQGQLIQGTPNASIGRRFPMFKSITNSNGQKELDNVKTIKYVVMLDNNGDKKSTNINVGYAHKYFGVGDVGLSYQDGKVGFSSNISVKYDEMFNQTSYYPQ